MSGSPSNGSWKSFVIAVSSGIIVMLLSVVGWVVKSAYEDMHDVHVNIIKEIASLKRCQ